MFMTQDIQSAAQIIKPARELFFGFIRGLL